jgi:hypothetical protein
VFFDRELKHEIGGKPLVVAFHLFVEALDWNAVKLGDVGVKDDPLMAEK